LDAERLSRSLQLHPSPLPLIQSSSHQTIIIADVLRRTSDGLSIALGQPGMSTPSIFLIRTEALKSRLLHCLLLGSSQALLHLLSSICASIFACSSTPHMSYILATTLMVLSWLSCACCTVRNEPRPFLLTQFSQHFNPYVLRATEAKRPRNIETRLRCGCSLLFLQFTLGGVLNTLLSPWPAVSLASVLAL
jgi:hypothetical protein